MRILENNVFTVVGLKKKKLRRLRRPLTAEEKALATQLIQSAKSRRDLLEWNFHRYRFFDEEANLPDWFVNEEKKHMRKAPPLEVCRALFTYHCCMHLFATRF